MMQAPLALTMGEPAGIGGEITLKAWLRRHEAHVPAFFSIDDPARLSRLAERLGWPVAVAAIDDPAEAVQAFDRALPVLSRPLPGSTTPGRPDAANTPTVLRAIAEAVEFVREGRAGAVVTNPINKQVVYAAGFRHPGHTEYLAELAGGGLHPVMMLACPGLRVVPVTVHQSLAEAVRSLTTEAIVAVAELTAAALERDFGIAAPHLSIAALNPHAGEGGSMGREESEIIAPAISILKKKGLSVFGPAPADTLFHERARKSYDAAICMYHDQALIPIKTIDFHGGVNVTLGLPFIRTSPDHGTAFEIAGTGVADEQSLVAALHMAADMAACRAAAKPRHRQEGGGNGSA